jgi:hypothetical protein
VTEAIVIPQMVLGSLLAIVAFFVRQTIADARTQAIALESITHRIVVLEVRERAVTDQVAEIKDKLDLLGNDIRFVREKIVALVGQSESTQL